MPRDYPAQSGGCDERFEQVQVQPEAECLYTSPQTAHSRPRNWLYTRPEAECTTSESIPYTRPEAGGGQKSIKCSRNPSPKGGEFPGIHVNK
eukprot:5538818-Pyramimonas_sp.AAC.1